MPIDTVSILSTLLLCYNIKDNELCRGGAPVMKKNLNIVYIIYNGITENSVTCSHKVLVKRCEKGVLQA
jgi:hypothetical protein